MISGEDREQGVDEENPSPEDGQAETPDQPSEEDLDLEVEEGDDGNRLKEGFTGQER